MHFRTEAHINQQRQSPLFDELPPELRQMIWKSVFENTNASINLSSALCYKPGTNLHSGPGLAATPSSALLRTCKKLHEEAKDAFDESFRTFWDKEFIVDNCKYPDPDHYLDRIPKSYIASIRKLTVLVSRARYPLRLQLSIIPGNWTVHTTSQAPNHSSLEHALSRYIASQATERAKMAMASMTVVEPPHKRGPLCTLSHWRLMYLLGFFDTPPLLSDSNRLAPQ